MSNFCSLILKYNIEIPKKKKNEEEAYSFKNTKIGWSRYFNYFDRGLIIVPTDFPRDSFS